MDYTAFNHEITQTPEPIDVAAVLRKVAESRHYQDALRCRQGMCSAMILARHAGMITREERRTASREVESYVYSFDPEDNMYAYLRDALQAHNLPHSDDYLRDIYLDWDNRPRVPK